ncbi:membrane-associated protein, putative [Bodo saltans]|uniref:Membrane-associated protein, putative n=1 Tax=Bodo saltans TaxID=75058 RepID=A0A0S4J5Z0_BODSA|nr:membrane-associated protein, putative [Bodo saltans]|eukprot:CUG85034.1 membrane-associated protein, putative [Bodo saltans]
MNASTIEGLLGSATYTNLLALLATLSSGSGATTTKVCGAACAVSTCHANSTVSASSLCAVQFLLGFPAAGLPLTNATLMAQVATTLQQDLAAALGSADVTVANTSVGDANFTLSDDSSVALLVAFGPRGVSEATIAARISDVAFVRLFELLSDIRNRTLTDFGVSMTHVCGAVCVANGCNAAVSVSPSSICVEPDVLDPAIRNGAVAAAVVVGASGVALGVMMLGNGGYVALAFSAFPLIG